MTRAIFDLFRHGRAETACGRDPFVLINGFAPELVETHDSDTPGRQQPIRLRWAAFAAEGVRSKLRMCWEPDTEAVSERAETRPNNHSAA
jgi:hypothetical protein